MSAKFRRGEVYLVEAPAGRDSDGNLKVKLRPMIVLKSTDKKPLLVPLVYCTTQNKILSHPNQIKVERGSPESYSMGLNETTYVIATDIKRIPVENIGRPIGECTFMNKIDALLENWRITGAN